MVKLRASAVRLPSEDVPGWVEVSVRDARGDVHCIVEKVPVVLGADIGEDVSFPLRFWLEVEVVGVDGDETLVRLPHAMETTSGLRTLVIVSPDADRARYRRDRAWLDYAFHELPSGVLWGHNGATPAQCAQMLEGLDDFAGVCARLGLEDHVEFIEACRWHLDHYPHYLERRRHFRDYATYVRDRRGPLRVPPPPIPGGRTP